MAFKTAKSFFPGALPSIKIASPSSASTRSSSEFSASLSAFSSGGELDGV